MTDIVIIEQFALDSAQRLNAIEDRGQGLPDGFVLGHPCLELDDGGDGQEVVLHAMIDFVNQHGFGPKSLPEIGCSPLHFPLPETVEWTTQSCRIYRQSSLDPSCSSLKCGKCR